MKKDIMKKLALILLLSLMFLPSAYAQGPVVLMGIDAEDGGVDGHGPITSYVSIINDILSNVSNGGNGILVFGGGSAPTPNDVTEFWNAISTMVPVPVTFVNGPANIENQSFTGFQILAVASDVNQTADGGLTQAENDALAARQADVANFVNTGGGLIGFSQTEFTNPYAYVSAIGDFVVVTDGRYDDITPTAEGESIGITDVFDIVAWHDTYVQFPAFLQVLAYNSDQGSENPEQIGQPAAIGGLQVIILSDVAYADLPTLSEVGLIIMALILGVFGFIALRKKRLTA